jgi:hypothetical protein
MKIGYFTAGTVGGGHIVRGLAIARGLRRAGYSGRFRIFSPIAIRGAGTWAEQEVVRASSTELEDPTSAWESVLATAIYSYAPDLVIVDLFWAPLRHVLPELRCEAWLLLRKHPRWWFSGTPRRRFVSSQFARIIAIEPFRSEHASEMIDPIVVCNPEECHDATGLRQLICATDAEPLVIAICGGRPEEMARLVDGRDCYQWNLFDPNAPFPAAEWLPGADAVLCGAGYNSFWEAAWLGYARRAIFVPFARSVDSQEWRLATCLGRRVTSNGADVLAHWIMQP